MATEDTICERCGASLDNHPRACPECGNNPLMDATKTFGGLSLVLFAVSVLFPPLILVGLFVLAVIGMAWVMTWAGWSGYSPAKQDLPWGRR